MGTVLIGSAFAKMKWSGNKTTVLANPSPMAPAQTPMSIQTHLVIASLATNHACPVAALMPVIADPAGTEWNLCPTTAPTFTKTLMSTQKSAGAKMEAYSIWIQRLVIRVVTLSAKDASLNQQPLPLNYAISA